MTGAIEFLKHLKKWCDKNYCYDCPYKTRDGKGQVYCRIGAIVSKTDDEIADLVREVERWWKENGE